MSERTVQRVGSAALAPATSPRRVGRLRRARAPAHPGAGHRHRRRGRGGLAGQQRRPRPGPQGAHVRGAATHAPRLEEPRQVRPGRGRPANGAVAGGPGDAGTPGLGVHSPRLSAPAAPGRHPSHASSSSAARTSASKEDRQGARHRGVDRLALRPQLRGGRPPTRDAQHSRCGRQGALQSIQVDAPNVDVTARLAPSHHIDSRPTPPPAGASCELVVITPPPTTPRAPPRHRRRDQDVPPRHRGLAHRDRRALTARCRRSPASSRPSADRYRPRGREALSAHPPPQLTKRPGEASNNRRRTHRRLVQETDARVRDQKVRVPGSGL